jgi:adenosylcobinamide-phosphate synthase
MIYTLIALLIGFVLDLLFGDPHWLWHPIRLIGSYISFVEKVIRALLPKNKTGEQIGGVLLVLMVVFGTTVIPVLILYILYQLNPMVGLLLESIFCYQLLATKALKVESMKVYHALKYDSLEAGRKSVSMIVGRDTNQLSQDGVIKATVETVAENTSDGSIAPMFYMILGGAGLGFFYKAVNTMDSMVGYKNETYQYFGTCAAKLDDILNFIPARLSAYFMIFGTIFTKFHTKNAYGIYRRDRYRHASPNSAHTEAVTAGALQIQLAGDAYYFGQLHKKETIGDPIRTVEIEDIKRANTLLYCTAWIGIILFGLVKGVVILWNL